MPDHWFRLPQAGSGTYEDPAHPAYLDTAGIWGYAGSTIGASPRWVARVYGTEAALDEIAARADVSALSVSDAAAAFDRADVAHLPDTGWSASTVTDRFATDADT